MCEGLAQRGQLIEDRGLVTWPDGMVSGQYGFRHTLYQEVLYQRLGTGRRARVHLAIGTREEAGYREQANERAAELAQHFVQGCDLPRAVRYLLQAGQNALRRAAHVEAVNHFSQGLTLLAAQPETRERAEQELRLQLGLGITRMLTKGFAVPEVEQAFTRAHTLCHQIGDAPELFPVLAGLWTFYFARGEQRTARPLAEQVLQLAYAANDPALLAVAHTNMQITSYMQGKLAAAHDHGEQALAQFSASPFFPLEFSYGPDTAGRARSCAAAILHALGYLDQARQQTHAALVLAKELRHMLTVVETLQMTAGIHGGCREWAEMQVHAAELMALAMTQGLPFWWAMGTCSHGIALTQQGDLTEGISQIRQGLAVYRASGATIGITRVLGWLAEAYGQAGQIEEGFAVLADAFAVVEHGDEHLWEAELYRRKGELTLQSRQVENKSLTGYRQVEGKATVINPQSPTPNPQAEAEACFLKAIAIAQRQQAKLWELRAAMSLCRLWQQQDKQKEAHLMLAKVYGWFTEGFDTTDLQEAKTLLSELADTA